MNINPVYALVKLPSSFQVEHDEPMPVTPYISSWTVPVEAYISVDEKKYGRTPQSVLYIKFNGERSMLLEEVQQKTGEILKSLFNNNVTIEYA
ncbi:hypothetical protein MTZ49_10205 [Entomomonas sp. E2T0]|uniref:hypothetical protein n=1 Tax=Entomomonas sp. E2T0 TaxID=2930213 RepID=UPI0022283E84|nr:hypothetical protein [Entomomonas sp. E2T0]UYZ82981.1 hypothetical protein MTZ49_10205 [Entomomonas sp. E2T0]